jgi:ATP-dependent Clp protease protease subunit
VEKIAADTDRDYWLSAEDAKEYGLVGKIITQPERNLRRLRL